MEVKKYQARTMNQALRAIKRELGQDAVIVSTRELYQDNQLGALSERMIEVTATKADNNNQRVTSKAVSTTSFPSVELANQPTARDSGNLGNSVNSNNTNQKVLPTNNLLTQEMSALSFQLKDLQSKLKEANVSSQNSLLQAELQQLKQLISFMLQQQQTPLPSHYPSVYQQLHLLLKRSGINEQHIHWLLGQLYDLTHEKKADVRKQQDIEQIYENYLIRLMLKQLPVSGGIEPSESPAIISLIGASGIGKTSLIAKLAASFSQRQSLSTAVIGIDNYKVAANDQLRTTCQLLKISYFSVRSAWELSEQIRQLSSNNVILIDGEIDLPENFSHKIHKYAVVSAILDSEFTKTFLQKTVSFHGNTLQGLIVTFMDKSLHTGNIYNLAVEFKLPLVYFSTGSTIPDDLITATKEYVIERIFQ